MTVPLNMKYDGFGENLKTSLQEIRAKEDFFDVTLVCDDDQIQCHKLILSLSSDWFKNIFLRNPHSHPLIVLKSIKLRDLSNILDFVYNGEVNVSEDHLESFINTADYLKIKGLYCPTPVEYLVPPVGKTTQKKKAEISISISTSILIPMGSLQN